MIAAPRRSFFGADSVFGLFGGVLFLSVMPLSACTDPDASESEPRTGLITGTVLYSAQPPSSNPCTPSPLRGNVIVLLFDERNPPPPEGSGTPVNFIVVPAAALFDAVDDSASRVFAAPYTMPTVPAGRYQIRAFLDADGDFNPTIGLLSQPTAGDVLGGHVDAVTGALRTVAVEDDRVTAQVVVSVGRPLPVERPAFAHTTTTTFDVAVTGPVSLRLESLAKRPIQRARVTMTPECTHFLVRYVDSDGNGVPDDANNDHLPDVYPRVLLRRIEATPSAERIVVPGIVNPYPFIHGLAESPTGVLADELEVIIPGIAVRVGPSGQEMLPRIPAGEYETVVMSSTGQTWTVPNDLDAIQIQGGPDASQSTKVIWQGAESGVIGRLQGSLAVASDSAVDAIVAAFAATDPPPPRGTGRPVGATMLSAARFTEVSTGRWTADFSIESVPDGAYLITAIADFDRNLSPLVDFVAQPSMGDLGGSASGTVVVAGGEVAAVGTIEVITPYPSDRPAFEFDEVSLEQPDLPAFLELRPHGVAELGISAESARVPVALAGTDANGDNLPDVYPIVLLSLMSSSGDSRIAPDDPRRIVLPAAVDPLPFLAALGGGQPLILADKISLILPPYAVDRTTGQLVRPVPAGRYRVNVLSRTGQTWSAPNDLDVELGKAGTSADDGTQARSVTIENENIPGGVIAGTLQIQPSSILPQAPEDCSVVVLAYAITGPDPANLEPPLGDRFPRATSMVPCDRLRGTEPAAYRLTGLETGDYEVVAFLDADDDFVPWFFVMSQPTAGDYGGGYIDQGRLAAVRVNALGAPSTDVNLTIANALRFATDPPAFSMPSSVRLDPSGGSIVVTLTRLVAQTDARRIDGRLRVGWFDRDNNGSKDDVDGDGHPDLFPIVVADLLEPADPSNRRLASDRIRIRGTIDPAQFDPPLDPDTNPVVEVLSSVRVSFPASAYRLSNRSAQIPPPRGRYRVTLINERGQRWSLPNDLGRAVGTPFADPQGAQEQGRSLTVN